MPAFSLCCGGAATPSQPGARNAPAARAGAFRQPRSGIAAGAIGVDVRVALAPSSPARPSRPSRPQGNRRHRPRLAWRHGGIGRGGGGGGVLGQGGRAQQGGRPAAASMILRMKSLLLVETPGGSLALQPAARARVRQVTFVNPPVCRRAPHTHAGAAILPPVPALDREAARSPRPTRNWSSPPRTRRGNCPRTSWRIGCASTAAVPGALDRTGARR